MKFFGCLLKILAVLILFIGIGIFTIFITPYLTAENYEYDDTPNGSFRVIVAGVDDVGKEMILGSISIYELSELEENVDYKIYRSKSEGQCSDISFWCQATITGPQKQTIELKYSQENFQLYNKYDVVNGKIEPIYFRKMDRGDAILGFLISIVFTPVVLLLLRFSVKKISIRKASRLKGGQHARPQSRFKKRVACCPQGTSGQREGIYPAARSVKSPTAGTPLG